MTLSFAALVVLAGCQVVSTAGNPVAKVEAMSDHVAGPPREPTPVADPPIADLEAGETKYEIAAGKDAGKTIVRTVRRVDEDEASPWRRDMGHGRVQYLRRTDEGVVELTAIEEAERKAITRFDEALVVMTPKLKPDEPLKMTTKATVFSRDDPGVQIDRGDCAWTLTYDADQRIVTPAGTFDCRRIRAEYRGQFSLAKVTSVTWLYYTPTGELAAEHYEERGTAIFLPWTKTHTILLAE